MNRSDRVSIPAGQPCTNLRVTRNALPWCRGTALICWVFFFPLSCLVFILSPSYSSGSSFYVLYRYDDDICKGLIPLGQRSEVNQSPAQSTRVSLMCSKQYQNTCNSLPPFGNSGVLALRMKPYVPSPQFFTNSGDPGRAFYQILDMRNFALL